MRRVESQRGTALLFYIHSYIPAVLQFDLFVLRLDCILHS